MDPTLSLAKTSIWIHGAIMILAFLALKLMLLLFWPFMTQSSFTLDYRSDNLLMTLALWEMMEKVIGLCIVRIYIVELNRLLHPGPSVHFYSVYVPPSAPPLSEFENGHGHGFVNPSYNP